MSLLYNSPSNTFIINQFANDSIVGNIFLDNIQLLKNEENLIEVDCEDIYKYRPDVIARKYYGDSSYYHIVLIANGLGTLLHFIPSKFNNKIKLVKTEVIEKLLGI